ncbi:MAG: type II toxin-antitoxin system RelE family toxin [Dehalococcoidia bacterium]
MTYALEVSRSADTYLQRQGRRLQERTVEKFARLSEDPFDPQHSKPLPNTSGRRSARVGGWRILFTVDPEARVVRIDTIAPRGQVYRCI